MSYNGDANSMYSRISYISPDMLNVFVPIVFRGGFYYSFANFFVDIYDTSM